MVKKTQLEKLREAERELSAQLGKLRSQIAAAEKGLNKRIKDANKYIARTNRIIAKTAREQERIQEKELAKLERFLGETFETVQEARQALVKQTAKPTKREKLAYLQTEKQKLEVSASKSKSEKQRTLKRKQIAAIEREIEGRKLDPSKPTYKVRQLSDLEKQRILDFLTDRKSWNEIGTGYLQPNERITVSVPYRYYGPDGRQHIGHALGRRIFRDWAAFQAYLISYIGEDSTEDWLGDIEIIKFENEYNYRVERGRQTDTIHKRRKEVKALLKGREKKLKEKIRATERKKQEKLKEQNRKLKAKLKGRKRGK